MNKLSSVLMVLGCLLQATAGYGQQLTLPQVQESSAMNYPLIKQRALLQKANQYSLENISKTVWPQVTVNGQATYQSDVLSIPISLPNVSFPEQSKDQYRLYAEAVQPVTDMITVGAQKDVQRAANKLEADRLESELYKLRERVNSIYFGILLIDEQRRQNALTKSDIQMGINKVSAAVQSGTDYRSNLDKLKAQLLVTEQRDIDLKALRSASINMLALFVGHGLPDTIALERPAPVATTMDISRPELRAYESQALSYDAQSKLIGAKSLPKLSVYIQGGYGKPGLNQLSNEFKSYYIGGLRLNWSLSSLYTLKKDQRILAINKEMVSAQKETFLFNTSLALRQQSEEVVRLQESLRTDDEIIRLRSSVKSAAQAQLQNGVITVSDFLREVNNEALAREQNSLHQIQLLQAQYNIKITTGN
jgi:outer membrane protein TolC